jgi:hypothetical protein
LAVDKGGRDGPELDLIVMQSGSSQRAWDLGWTNGEHVG